jgi:hypothetical protein
MLGRACAKPKSAAGPDFVVEGHAYECKGTDFDKKRLFSQLLQYASQYSGVSLVLPYDALTLELIWKLKAIEQFLRRDLELYLVADIDDRMYAIRRIGSAGLLDMRVHQALNSLAQKFSSISSVEEKEKRILEFLENMESELIKELKELIAREAAACRSAWEGGVFYLQ